MTKKLVEGMKNWTREYLEDCKEHARTHENMKYIKKYWYLLVGFLAVISGFLGWIVWRFNKKDELERKLKEERRIDKKHYRVR